MVKKKPPMFDKTWQKFLEDHGLLRDESHAASEAKIKPAYRSRKRPRKKEKEAKPMTKEMQIKLATGPRRQTVPYWAIDRL